MIVRLIPIPVSMVAEGREIARVRFWVFVLMVWRFALVITINFSRRDMQIDFAWFR